MSVKVHFVDLWPVTPLAPGAPPYEHPARDMPHCQTLRARATQCYADHHAKYAEHVIGAPAHLAIKGQIARSNAACFSLALQHARECGGGVSISPPRAR